MPWRPCTFVRKIPIEGSHKSWTYFFEDQGEHTQVCEQESAQQEKLLHFCFSNLRTQFIYQSEEETKIFQYRSRGGARMPLCFSQSQGTLGVYPLESPEELSRHIATANSFLKSYPNSKVLFLHPLEEKPRAYNSQIMIAPAAWVS